MKKLEFSKLNEKLLVQHLQEQLYNQDLISLIFEEVQEFKHYSHIDNEKTLTMMLEFFGPFKSKGVADLETHGKSNLISNLKKNLKQSVVDALKASKELKSVDLTNSRDVAIKVGSLVQAVSTVSLIDKDLTNGEHEGVDPSDVVTPDLDKAMKSLYVLASYTLNQTRLTLNNLTKDIQHTLPQAVTRAAVTSHQDSVASQSTKDRMTADLKGITAPVHKQVGSWIGGALGGNAWGPQREAAERPYDDSVTPQDCMQLVEMIKDNLPDEEQLSFVDDSKQGQDYLEKLYRSLLEIKRVIHTSFPKWTFKSFEEEGIDSLKSTDPNQDPKNFQKDPIRDPKNYQNLPPAQLAPKK